VPERPQDGEQHERAAVDSGGAVEQDFRLRLLQRLQTEKDAIPKEFGRFGQKVVVATVPQDVKAGPVADRAVIKLELHIDNVRDPRPSQLFHVFGRSDRATHRQLFRALLLLTPASAKQALFVA